MTGQTCHQLHSPQNFGVRGHSNQLILLRKKQISGMLCRQNSQFHFHFGVNQHNS